MVHGGQLSHFDPRIHPSNGTVQSQKEGLPNEPSSRGNTKQRRLYVSSSGSFPRKRRFPGAPVEAGAGREALQPFLPGQRTDLPPHCPTTVRSPCPSLQGLLFPAHPTTLAPLQPPEPQNSYLRGGDAALADRAVLSASRTAPGAGCSNAVCVSC